jgi:hypothetical protein
MLTFRTRRIRSEELYRCHHLTFSILGRTIEGNCQVMSHIGTSVDLFTRELFTSEFFTFRRKPIEDPI